MAKIILAEIGYYDPTTSSAGTLRLSTGAGYDHPSAPGPYRGCIADNLTLRRSIYEDEQSFGGGLLALGELTAINAKLAGETVYPFDFLVARACAIDGRTTRFLAVEDDANYTTAQLIATGEGETFFVDLDNETVLFRWRDEMAKVVDQPVQLTTYLGNNTPPNGVEGGAEIKDRWKPWLAGYGFNISPVLVNSAKLLYQVSDLAVKAITIEAVRDKGAPLAFGQTRSSIADLQANTPAAGKYDVYAGSATDGCYIRLGSNPVGAVTCDARAGATAADRTLAQLWKRTLVERLGVAPAAISDADVAALDATETAPVDMGWFIDLEPTTGRDLLDRWCQGRAVYWRDEAGLWRIKAIAPPGGVATRTFVVLDENSPELGMTDLELYGAALVASSGDNDLPFQEVTVGYAHNFTRQAKDSLAGVALDKQQLYAQDEQTRKWSNDTIATLHPRARRMQISTGIRNEADALAVANTLGALLGATRRRLRGNTDWVAAAGGVQLGNDYAVRMSRIGLSSGKHALLVRADLELIDGHYELELWGLTWP